MPIEPGRRTAWIDIAKAIAILLVVVYHITSWFAGVIAPALFDFEVFRVWRELSRALIPVRIPLFFLVSGLLAHSAIRRPWRDLRRSRFDTLLWVFALWTVVVAIPWSFRVDIDDPLRNSAMVWQSLVFGGSHFWFLPALVVFLSLAKLLVRWPGLAVAGGVVTAVVIAPLVSPSLGALGPVLGVNIERWMLLGMWFLIGCFAGQVVQWFARRSSWWLVAAVLGFLAFRQLIPMGPVAYRIAVVGLGVCGVAALILLSTLLARSAAARRIGTYLAHRTLPLYVGHAFVLELMAVLALALNAAGAPRLPVNVVVAAAFVPVTFLIAVGASLGLQALSRRWRMPWLFQAPNPSTTRSSPI